MFIVRLLKSLFIVLISLFCFVLIYCIKTKIIVSISEDKSDEIVTSGSFFDACHDIYAKIERKDSVKKITYVLSADEVVLNKDGMYSDNDYVRYLVNKNLPFLTFQDWKFLIKTNAMATVVGIVTSPLCLFVQPSYSKENLSSIKGQISPEYLYSMINYCKEKNIEIRPVVLPYPRKKNKKDLDACVDLLQHYLGGVLDYSDLYVPVKYVNDGVLTEIGKSLVEKAILANISGVHSQEYVDLNIIQNVNKDSPLLKFMYESGKVVFVGNSITDGCNNGGYGWYESLMAAFPSVEVVKISKGGATSNDMVQWSDTIAAQKADLYVIAAGCNDIKVGDPKTGAVSYIRNLQTITDYIRKKKSNARFVFIAPWQRFPETEVEKIARLQYTHVQKVWCKKNNFVFVDPNPYIADMISKSKYFNYYMIDRTHPNSSNGMKMYSEAVLNSAEN